jgi:hypothetical protein
MAEEMSETDFFGKLKRMSECGERDHSGKKDSPEAVAALREVLGLPARPAESWEGRKVWSRDGNVCGIASGHTKPCTLECCGGTRVMVRWPSGKRTWPCSKGMQALAEDEYRIY